MDSGNLGATDNNSDLNFRERLRWGANSKVYTRKNFRKKSQLETPNNVASTAAVAATPSLSATGNAESSCSSPVKHESCSKNATLEPFLAETLAAENGNSSEEHPQSSSGGEPTTSCVVRLPEEGAGGQEVVPCGEEGMPLNDDQEDREVLPDVQEAVASGGREEPTSSSGHEPLPETQPTGGQEEILPEKEPTDSVEEEPTQRNGSEAEQGALASTREDPSVRERSEVAVTLSITEGPDVTRGHGPEALPDVQEAVPCSDREEPTSSNGHEPLPLAQPTGGQEEILPETQPTDSGEEEPTQRDGQGAEQGSLASNKEDLPQRERSEVAVTLSVTEEQEVTRGNGPETEQGLPSRGEDPPERKQSEVAGTVPITEGPDASHGDVTVSCAASTGLVNGFAEPFITRVEDRVRINITGLRSKDEMRKLKRKLESELDQVRSSVEKVEAKEDQLTAYNTSNVNTNSSHFGGIVGNFGGYQQPQLLRANSEVGKVGHPYSRPELVRVNSEVGSGGYHETRPFRHLSVSVVENNHGAGGFFVEKEKRTPKANQYYRNSEFLLGKDRLPLENNKKLKLSAKKHGGDAEYGYGFGFDKNRNKVFRSCSNLLQRLMKHKHAWVFNEPVDPKKLNIPDYHFVIKHPMDFGTIKTRLAQNWYKSAREFAEDVRLVFRNAMTYNPKGQDVHIMAEELSMIFEEKWIAIEKEFFPHQMYYDAGLPIPTPRKAPPPPAFATVPAPILAPAPPMRTLDRSESMMMPVDSRLKPSYSNFPHVGRTPLPKKPKAKDPNKRDMTYEEKQKLSTNLQSLPSEKLDAIVQIIKKRNSALSQHNDEIEVDIDSVDAETLWELDRFVTNYKKSLSKNKRKAELALQRRAEAARAVPTTNPTPAVAEAQKESRTGDKNGPVVEVEKQNDNVSGSSSSSSSSSDSGSSSSDSDSDSSSAYGSDAGHSPKI